jgi:hypothetical protein
MPFEISDGVRLADPVGPECDSEHDAVAKAKADMIEQQIATEIELWTARCVAVLDEVGAEVCKAAVNK